MKLTVSIKLCPTSEQREMLDTTANEYISLVNDILDYAVALGEMPKLTTASLKAALPSAVKNQCIREARSIWSKTLRHNAKLPTLRKPVAIWNNQNDCISSDFVSIPIWVAGKSKRISIPAIILEEMSTHLQNRKLSTLRITKKSGKYIAQVAYHAVEGSASPGMGTMGVDLGIKCPAVAVISDETVRFYGNGRQNKQIRRHYATRRKKLGKAKKLKAIRKFSDKKQRWMKDQDHKISRAIVNDAVAHNVGTIKLENLSGIRKSARKSRKNNHGLHNWSFYRLAQFIEYKAKLAGIKVIYVNPAYTSQTCPICGGLHHAQDRTYVCPDCGYRSHRDIIGARNILAA